MKHPPAGQGEKKGLPRKQQLSPTRLHQQVNSPIVLNVEADKFWEIPQMMGRHVYGGHSL